MMRALRGLTALALLLVAAAASAFQTFQIEEVYSTADGAVQYVVLRESAAMNNQQDLAGHVLTVTSGAVVKAFAFPANLPSAITANHRVLIATQGFADLGLLAPDYIIPAQFVPTAGGTFNYAGVDQVVFAPLPTDGFYGMARAGTAVPNYAINFIGQAASVPPMPVTAIEYYAVSLDHYFISSLQPDIDALDSHRIPGWARTGQQFKVHPSLAAADLSISPVCRFYIPPQHGNSHFFSASPLECLQVVQKSMTDPNYSGFVYETPDAFFLYLPNTATGICPALTTPVYRLWNQRPDTNHRYTTDPATRNQMIAMGYVAEGYGNIPVSMCSPIGVIDRGTVKINAVAWIDTQFIAVGSAGATGIILGSADGISWTVRNAGTPSLRGVTWSGSLAVVLGSNGTILTSSDGLAWTPQVSNTTSDLNRAAWTGNQFVAVGTGGVLLLSADGISWTLRPSKVAVNLYDVMQSGNKTLIVGAAGTILSSNDGTNWNPRTSGTANDLFRLTQTGSKVIAVGDQGTILASGDSGNTWSAVNSGTQTPLNGVVWSGSQLIAAGGGGRIFSSTSGSVWKSQISGIGDTLNDIAWSGSLFAAMGVNGAIVTSPDGIVWTSR
jgi:photosystem II stability/assembly factor-like uncharacterized protein